MEGMATQARCPNWLCEGEQLLHLVSARVGYVKDGNVKDGNKEPVLVVGRRQVGHASI